MNKSASLICHTATFGILLLSGVSTMHGAAITFNTALPVPQEQFIWREQLVLRERSASSAMHPEVSAQALGSVLGYGLNSKLALFGMIPYFFDKELDVTTPMGRIERSTAGVGDISLLARYTAYQQDRMGSTFRIAPFLGVTAPTGDYEARDEFGEIPRPLQAGDGAWDVFGGVVATYQTLQYQVDTQLLYRENGRHQGFAHGDETRFDASLQYRIWPRTLDNVSGTPGFVYAVLESNLIHRERSEVGNSTDNDSGGMQWLLAPGLQYVSRNWIFEGTVQLPVSSSPHGTAIDDDYIVRIGFRRNF